MIMNALVCEYHSSHTLCALFPVANCSPIVNGDVYTTMEMSTAIEQCKVFNKIL